MSYSTWVTILAVIEGVAVAILMVLLGVSNEMYKTERDKLRHYNRGHTGDHLGRKRIGA